MEASMNITIDGKEYACKKGEYLLDVARRNNIYIPTLCYHEGLGSLGACRVCIVELIKGGRSSVVVSCVYPIEEEGLKVLTTSDKIKEQRGIILTLLARLAPNAEVIKQMADFAGIDLPLLVDKADGDRCILCGRCTTACELVGSGAIAKINRGTTKAIDTPYDEPSAECIGCASCAHVCPTGSIPYTETAECVTIWGRTFALKRCDVCGSLISTDELIANAQAKAEGKEPDAPLCAACRKMAVAEKIRRSVRF